MASSCVNKHFKSSLSASLKSWPCSLHAKSSTLAGSDYNDWQNICYNDIYEMIKHLVNSTPHNSAWTWVQRRWLVPPWSALVERRKRTRRLRLPLFTRSLTSHRFTLFDTVDTFFYNLLTLKLIFDKFFPWCRLQWTPPMWHDTASSCKGRGESVEGGREVRRARTPDSSPPPHPPPPPPPRAGEPPPSCRPPAPPPPRAGSQTWATTAPCQGRGGRQPRQASTRWPSLILPGMHFTPLVPHLLLILSHVPFIDFHPSWHRLLPRWFSRRVMGRSLWGSL